MSKPIPRRTFLKGVGAATAGITILHMTGCSILAAEESDAEMPVATDAPVADASGEAGGASQEAGTFVYKPFWDENNLKTAIGGEILFFGDVHDFENDYFYYDPVSGETRGVFTYLVNEGKRPGLYVSIGDYLQASSDIIQGADVYNRCIDRIRAWGGEDIPIVSVMGNHEFKTAGADGLNGEAVFERAVGNNNYGLIAKGVEENDPEKVLYYVVAFGCAHAQEIDAANTRANAANKYWVNPDQIAELDKTLASIYGEDGSQNQGIPTFIDAHLPVHYYTTERSAENNCDLLTVLNKYPYVVYVWGHNHSEKDPCYGGIKLPGDTIVPNAGLDELNSDGEPAAKEINFTYISCGAVRGNQISDNTQEDSERALYVTVDGSKLSFEYCGRNGNVFDRTAYDAIQDETYFENFRTRPARSAAGLTVDIAERADKSVIRCGDFFLERPIAGKTPGSVISFSRRYSTSIQWLDSAGNPIDEAFANGEAYTARLTLSAQDAVFDMTADDVYLSDMSAVAIPYYYISGRTISISSDGTEAAVEIGFIPTAAMAEEPLAPASELVEGKRYVVASDVEQYLYTRARADCAAANGELLTVPNTDGYWTFEPVEAGFAMRSASGKYLTAGMNGPHVVLTPVADRSDGVYTVWSFNNGKLSINVSGAEYFLSYTAGDFALISGNDSLACLLYEIH